MFFGGCKIFDSAIFLGEENLASIFWVAQFRYRFSGGIQNNVTIRGGTALLLNLRLTNYISSLNNLRDGGQCTVMLE